MKTTCPSYVQFLSVLYHQVLIGQYSISEFDIATFNPSGNLDQLYSSVNCIHTERLDLLQVKWDDDIPECYSLFDNPFIFQILSFFYSSQSYSLGYPCQEVSRHSTVTDLYQSQLAEVIFVFLHFIST